MTRYRGPLMFPRLSERERWRQECLTHLRPLGAPRGSPMALQCLGFELMLPPRKKKQARDAAVRAAASAILRAVGV